MAPQWDFLEKRFHFLMIETKLMPTKQFLKGDHPMDMDWGAISAQLIFSV